MRGSRIGGVIRAFVRRGLSTLTVFVTDRCNARCSFCFNWRAVGASPRPDLLSTDEWRRLAAGTGPLPSLIVSGGEPFLRPDLGEIVAAFIERCDVRHLSIPTNAMLPVTAGMAAAIASAHPRVLVRLLVGIDGLGEDHDRLRGVKGGFEAVCATLAGLREAAHRHANLSLNAVTVYNAGNRAAMTEVADWVHGQGFFEHKLQMIRGEFPDAALALEDPDGFCRAEAYANELFHRRQATSAERAEGYSELFAAVNRYSRRLAARRLREQRAILPCLAGHRLLVVRENGDVFPCELLERRLGNVREVDFDLARLRDGEESRNVRTYIRKSGCWCTTQCNAVTDAVFSPRAWPGIGFEVVRGRIRSRS